MHPTRLLILIGLVAGLISLGTLATGCVLQRSDAPLTEGSDGTTIRARPGGTIAVSLESNKTTGFSWMVADLGPTRQIGQAEYEEPSSQLTGAAGREVFAFKAGDSGDGDLRLEYRRPWESDELPAEKSWSVTVRVE